MRIDSVLDRDAARVEAVEQRAQRARRRRRSGSWSVQRRRVGAVPSENGVAAAVERPGRRSNCEADVAAGDQPLELVGVPSATSRPRSSTAIAVGELVGLVEVLGGEEDRDAVGHEVADVLPQSRRLRGSRPGGRLVEEDDPRSPHQVMARSRRRFMPPE